MKKSTEIKKEISEEFNIAKKDISVRLRHYIAYHIEINKRLEGVVNLQEVRQFIRKFESVSRCEVTGEILGGGNRYVFANFSL